MKDGLDIGIITSGALVKKGYSFLIANIGKTVAIITLFVTALVSFTELSFSDFGSESFTSTLIMMLIASYIMYFSLEDAGEKLGRDSDGYKSASDKYEELKGKIVGTDIADLRKFCIDYRNADLEYRRSNLLFSLGYTEDEYKRYLDGEDMGKKMNKDLMRVKKMRRAELDTTTLLSHGRYCEGELKNPKNQHIVHMLIRLIPSTVCMIFTVSVMISLKDNMTVAGVVEALLKLSTLPIIGLKGYAAGYEYATESERGWLDIKSRILGSFLADKNK
jgi:translation elongation factor EF-G